MITFTFNRFHVKIVEMYVLSKASIFRRGDLANAFSLKQIFIIGEVRLVISKQLL